MITVTHVYKDVFPPIPGGIEKHLDTLRRALPTVRSNVVTCSRSRTTTIFRRESGDEIRVAELGRLWSVPISPGFPLRLRRTREDLVHLHMPNPLGEGSVLAIKGGTPMVVNYHADIVRQAALLPAYGLLIDACLRRASAIVVGTRGLRDSSRLLAPYVDEIRVIPYAVDQRRYGPSADLKEQARALRARFGEPLVVSVGRLVYYKGYDLLIDAMCGVPAQLLIAGDGPLYRSLQGRAAGLTNVHMLGQVPETELPVLLSAADCFVLPSTSHAESFGIATLEAQAAGVPAVVTDVGTGTVEAILPGETGLVVPPRDVRALREAIRSLLADEPRRVAMSNAAVKHVIATHASNVAAAAYLRLYEAVLMDRGGNEFAGWPDRDETARAP